MQDYNTVELKPYLRVRCIVEFAFQNQVEVTIQNSMKGSPKWDSWVIRRLVMMLIDHYCRIQIFKKKKIVNEKLHIYISKTANFSEIPPLLILDIHWKKSRKVLAIINFVMKILGKISDFSNPIWNIEIQYN